MLIQAFLLFASVFFSSELLASEILDDEELYIDRPRISNLEDVFIKDQGKIANRNGIGQSILTGMIHSLAMLFAVYPEDSKFYFMARDAEYLYDMAVLVSLAVGRIDLLERLHLINVSTALSSDPLLKRYLAENGMHENALKNGQKMIIVETGFMGTVPEAMIRLFPIEYQQYIENFMLDSGSMKYPSLKSFRKFADVGDLEQLKHYNRSATEYRIINDRTEPLARKSSPNQKRQGLENMAQVKVYMNNSGIHEFKVIYSFWREYLEIQRMKDESLDSSEIDEIERKLQKRNPTLFRIVEKDFRNKVRACRFCGFYREKKPSLSLEVTLADLERFDSLSSRRKARVISSIFYLNQFEVISKKLQESQSRRLDGVVIEQMVLFIHESGQDIVGDGSFWELFSFVLSRYDASGSFDEFEDLVSTSLQILFERNDPKLYDLILRKSIKEELEETLEKLLASMSRHSAETLIQYEDVFRKVIKKLERFDSPNHLVKIFTLNLLHDDLRDRMPRLTRKAIKVFSSLEDANRIRFSWRRYLLEESCEEALGG